MTIKVKTNASDDILCFFCNEIGHVKTGGPSGSHIIQHFACKKFVDSTPAERFRVLSSKGLCHRCLYPDASQKEGKHANGKWQSYYICKKESHKYPCKKHVLVCQEHSQSDENKELLNIYKSKHILNQKEPVEEFSKD